MKKCCGINKLILNGILFFTFIYIFFYQLSYPFNPAIFLYIIFILSLCKIIIGKKIKIDVQVILMFLILIISEIGIFYTENYIQGKREFLILSVMFLFLVVIKSDYELYLKLKKKIDIGAVLVVVGVFLQFILKDKFNNSIRFILRENSYEKLLWSFQIDNAYSGFSAYVLDASYFSAILFGKSIVKLIDEKKNYFFNLIFLLVTLFSIFLTNKRGIFLGAVFASLVAILITRKNYKEKIKNTLIFTLMAVVVIILLYFFSDSGKRFLNRFIMNENLTTGRFEMYMYAMKRFLDESRYILGYGTGAIYNIYSQGLHNIYLQILYDHGIIGLFIYLIFFIYNLKQAYNYKNLYSIYLQLVILIYGLSGNPIFNNMIFMTYLLEVSQVKKINIIKKVKKL